MLEFSKILEHVEHLYGHLPIPILVFDMHRIVRTANNAFCCLVEQNPADATGRLADECLERLAFFSSRNNACAFCRRLP